MGESIHDTNCMPPRRLSPLAVSIWAYLSRSDSTTLAPGTLTLVDLCVIRELEARGIIDARFTESSHLIVRPLRRCRTLETLYPERQI